MSEKATHGSISSRHHSAKSKNSSKSKSRSKSSTSSTKAHERVPSSTRPKNTSDALLTYSNSPPQTSQQPSWEEKSKATPSAHTNLLSGQQHTSSESLRYSLVDSAPTQQPHHLWQTHESLESLTYYLNDPTHSNPGYSVAYTNSLIYTYGFPDQVSARSELEDEIVEEAESRVRRSLDEYDSRC